MKQYKMPLILGCVAWVLAVLSLVFGIIDLLNKGVTTNTYFAAIIFIGAALSGINLFRLHRQLKYRKPPAAKDIPGADMDNTAIANKEQNEG